MVSLMYVIVIEGSRRGICGGGGGVWSGGGGVWKWWWWVEVLVVVGMIGIYGGVYGKM